MTIEEIVKIEAARKEPEQWGVIHFIKEGDFYRAHDWSAWLMAKFPFGEAAAKPLKVIAKKMKNDYIDAWCGFPASSIRKYIPDSLSFSAEDNAHITVAINLPTEIMEEGYEGITAMKEEWKNSLPLQESKKQRREDREVAEQAPRITRMSDIAARLVSLPLEDMSPREAWEYLRDLRRQVAALF